MSDGGQLNLVQRLWEIVEECDAEETLPSHDVEAIRTAATVISAIYDRHKPSERRSLQGRWCEECGEVMPCQTRRMIEVVWHPAFTQKSWMRPASMRRLHR